MKIITIHLSCGCKSGATRVQRRWYWVDTMDTMDAVDSITCSLRISSL